MRLTSYSEYYQYLSPVEKKFAPESLYYLGDFSLMTDFVKIAVVGSRQVSERGIKNTAVVSSMLCDLGYVVVSGLAMGVDTVAHQTAINEDGKTIAVVGTPLSKVTPKSNEDLFKLISQNHLAISQFKEGSFIGKQNFPIRNRTMALISDATIIIEAGETSGTQHQGWEALRLGRPLFLLDEIFINGEVSWAKKMIDYGAVRIKMTELIMALKSVSQLTLPNELPIYS